MRDPLVVLAPRWRKLVLTGHVAASVGWLGAVVAFLGLAAVGLTNASPEIVRGVYLVMEPAAWWALVPLALASFVTGLMSSLGSVWGLFLHYWVVFKLLINLFATGVLLMYMETFRVMADLARDSGTDLAVVRNPSPALHAVLALGVLLVATVLAIYKPRGLTPLGQPT